MNKGVQLSTIRDPEGNMITFIGDFRVQYWTASQATTRHGGTACAT